MIRKIIFTIILSSAMLFGCNNSETAKHEHTDATHEHTTGSSDNHDHDEKQQYSCPMHPEITRDKPGKCPKCGMTLKLYEKQENTTKFYMFYRSEPAQIEAGKPAKLIFRPQIEGKNDALVSLDVVHEQKIHLMIVSKDLSYFAHVHPENSANGYYNYSHTFPFGGDFVMFHDYAPTGGGHQLGRQEIIVNGKEKPAEKYTKENRNWEGNGYKLVLEVDKNPLKKGESTVLKVTVVRNGKPVTDLQNYLGALGHMAIISADTKQYLHVHPMESDSQRGFVINADSLHVQDRL
ncbi:MAG: hypothetical protein EOP53_25215 [Sphingobacteriales bacterium]|nr:MAG: hypothetical protein EOP53_25215 [Sphingobacteriales bacterium]